jgi:hypothetical protein
LEITGASCTLDVLLLKSHSNSDIMDEQCKAALELLVQNGYLETVKGKYRPTKKLNEVTAVEVIYLDNGTVFNGGWENLYSSFILACQVPKKGEAGDGGLYDLNKYSEDAMKHFRDLLKSGIRYSVLVQVTRAYYKTGNLRFKKTIGNYITQGHWRLDYDIVKDQTPEQQQQTLQKQEDESKPFTRDRIG